MRFFKCHAEQDAVGLPRRMVFQHRCLIWLCVQGRAPRDLVEVADLFPTLFRIVDESSSHEAGNDSLGIVSNQFDRVYELCERGSVSHGRAFECVEIASRVIYELVHRHLRSRNL